MKKFLSILLCLICILTLTSCSDSKTDNAKFSSKYANFEVVEIVQNGKILVDKDTGVLYIYYDIDSFDENVDGISVLYNADGSLKNISDFEK